MNPQELFCLNKDCVAKGQRGRGNIQIHSQKEKRCICTECGQTFSFSKGTIFYRLRTEPEIVVKVIILLSHGCPIPAIVAAYGLDERTIKRWQQLAGQHCQAVHEEVVEKKQLDLGQVQADEIKVKMLGFTVWMAMAIAVGPRLWLGGVISHRRDKALIEGVVAKIRKMALCRPLLLAVDGLASYPGAFMRAFRSPLPRRGAGGRPRLVSWPDIAIVQVVKQRKADGLAISRRIFQGGQDLVARLLLQTQQGGVINTAYIERLNATFRQRLAHLARRTRCPARESATLTAGMYIVGCFYNFCSPHKSLRVKIWITERTWRWAQRTPAIAAGITDHIWTPTELLWFRVPPEPWSPPKQRGRPSKETLKLIEKWCS